jgi:adenylate cyclase
MAVEIERKFLVRGDEWRPRVVTTRQVIQGYLANTVRSSVRVRLADGRGTLSVKAMTPGLSREEFEYEVPAEDALRMLEALCEGPQVAKRRHIVECEGHRFEVDEFSGDNEGLVLAELELDDESESGPRPGWLGEEVTRHGRYYSFRLASHPFRFWPEADREAARQGVHRQAMEECAG